MADKEIKSLFEKVQKARLKIKTGDKYFHYKNPDRFYEILAVGLIESSEEPCVVYRALYGDKVVWVRTIANFLEKVEVGGKKVKRFSVSGNVKKP
jgi:hypothetical protein